DALPHAIKILPAVQTLYCEIALDLHHETKEVSFLEKTAAFIHLASNTHSGISQLINLFQLKIAEENFSAAKDILTRIASLNTSNSFKNQLYAYLLIAQNKYDQAIGYYKKAL